MRGWKVLDNERQQRIGIAARNLDDLLQKSRKKFNIFDPNEEIRCYVAKDGTWIDDDDYLNSLQDHSALVIVRKGETFKTDLEHEIAKHTRSSLTDVKEAIQQLLIDNPDNFNELMRIIKNSVCRASYTRREDDPEWFEGIQPSITSKEDFLRRNIRQRMSMYYDKVKNALVKSDTYTSSRSRLKSKVNEIIAVLKDSLIKRNYQMGYFDRTDANRICEASGTFICGGVWNSDECKLQHDINPYSNYESRLLFRGWNLDHQFELSRSIIPKLIEFVQLSHNVCDNCREQMYITIDDYYNLIFTKFNLKLVSTVCHDKKKHDAIMIGACSCSPEVLIEKPMN